MSLSTSVAALVAIGCEVAFSTAAATTIHAALGPKTTPVSSLSYLYGNMVQFFFIQITNSASFI
jgi:hypothetical protein